MELRLYKIDTFTEVLFSGNPAAVCPLENWLPDNILQNIAAENNLSETAFFVKVQKSKEYQIRWFTPIREIDLFGHARTCPLLGKQTRQNRAVRQTAFKTRRGFALYDIG